MALVVLMLFSGSVEPSIRRLQLARYPAYGTCSELASSYLVLSFILLAGENDQVGDTIVVSTLQE